MPLFRNFSRPKKMIDREYSSAPRRGPRSAPTSTSHASPRRAAGVPRCRMPHIDEVPFGAFRSRARRHLPGRGRRRPVDVFRPRRLLARSLEGLRLRRRGLPPPRHRRRPRQLRALPRGDGRRDRAAVPPRRRLELAPAAEFNADPSRPPRVGPFRERPSHAMMLATDWTKHGLPADTIKAACPISGLFDLAPSRTSFLQPGCQLDDRQVAEQSRSVIGPRRLPCVPGRRSRRHN